MIGSFFTRGLVMVFGYAYPAYECFKSVEKNKPDIEQLRFWCQYWILVAVLTVCERIGDTFISWVPMYSEAKLAFYVYLWYPKTKGTAYVYDSFFRPYISKHETDIDRNLAELRIMAGDMAVLYWQRAANYVQTRTFDILQYIASQSTPKPRPSQAQEAGRGRKPPAAKQKGAAAVVHEETKEPSTSSSSSSSSSGSHQIEKSDAAEEAAPPASAVLKAQKSQILAAITQLQTTSEAAAEIESCSSDANPSPAPKETIMEEPVRVTRARLRKAKSIQ
ncbi:putative HVA22-like protein g [Cynara cardunculus var. scolymus]|uniref:putative HVA22-like protein g n=1 Tax=Cynara cardunculus var. scolymus TaxID=59895 RepID=UPI000D62F1C0|nr:putative HVA22-like protein g [Cynara cardunculus var. scolymus]